MPDKVFLPPPILSPVGRPAAVPQPQKAGAAEKEFSEYLAEATGLRLSHHAQERLAQRRIPLTGDTWQRVLAAVAKVAEKGGRDSLVLVDDLALVVNVPNRTVVTAVNGESLKERVFTQIDSAVIA
ncbi:MAG: hypothetical protein PWQ41_817 [Bacillota bacterium]|nr:hypothetical protein [Bacillota bacterium]MDK2925043.1 hypothetical protein [Bacillota bacterium]